MSLVKKFSIDLGRNKASAMPPKFISGIISSLQGTGFVECGLIISSLPIRKVPRTYCYLASSLCANRQSALPFLLEILSILSSTVCEQTGEEQGEGDIVRPLFPSRIRGDHVQGDCIGSREGSGIISR